MKIIEQIRGVFVVFVASSNEHVEVNVKIEPGVPAVSYAQFCSVQVRIRPSIVSYSFTVYPVPCPRPGPCSVDGSLDGSGVTVRKRQISVLVRESS